MRKRAPETAQVVQTLLWYNDPEILFLKKNTKEYIIAVAYPDVIDGLDEGHHFVGASLTEKDVRDYQDEKCDLRFAMANASYGRFWAFAFDGVDPEVTLSRYNIRSEVVRAALPESGFFARSHERIDIVSEFIADTDEKFFIDGSWDLGEFSSFYGKMEDIYYIANDIRRFEDNGTSAKAKQQIRETFKKPWRGGGSYLSYYKDIANDNAPTARLKVGGIQYNSPGFVRVEAKRRAFDDMLSMLNSYGKHVQAVKESYNRLHKYLSTHSLLKSSADTTLRPVLEAQIIEYGRDLSEYVDNVHFDTLLEMAEKNVLVAAKVQMSILRRVERLYEFFEQGRVRHPSFEADPLMSEVTPD